MNNLHKKIELALSEKIISKTSLGGGCIGDAFKIVTEAGNKYFVKHYSNSRMHKVEANGLVELSKTNAIRIPKVICANESFLCLELIDSAAQANNFSEEFGRQFARLHKNTATQFGFYENNFIGSTDQINLPQINNWVEFYFENRIMYQFRLAEKNGYSTEELRNGLHLIEKNIKEIFSGSDEPPTLLHGDLWGGNYMTDENGKPCLIDPAVYYGHREADLAMTKLFGGFDSKFYNGYNEEYPLKEGWEYRENLYKLYHILNHLNLFGSGYHGQVILLLNSYY